MGVFTNEGTENRMMWDRRSRSFMEVWYTTLNHPETGLGVWLRYTITAPTSEAREPYCELWGFVFDPERRLDFAAKDRYDISRLGASNGRDDGALVRIGDAWLSENHLDGSLEKDGRALRWSLDFEPAAHCFQHLPAQLRGRIEKRVSTVCSPNLAVPFSGVVAIDGRELVFDRARGSQSHRWGARHSLSWTWAHCSEWDEGEAIFEGLAAQAALGPVPAPRSTFVFLRHGGEDIAFNELRWAMLARSDYDLPVWSFNARTDRWKIHGIASASPAHMFQVTYEDPDGSKRYCANSEISDLVIHVFRKAAGGWAHDATLRAAGSAHLEFGRKGPFDEVPISL
ncbi:MAG: hypothetical protein M3198_07450 [Actinomycetota bacterium]|nr:hypothetical protein [Actinomycetota bacterium]